MPFEKPNADQLANRFSSHELSPGQSIRFILVRQAIHKAAVECVGASPFSPEQTRGLDALDEAMFLFNAAIARNG